MEGAPGLALLGRRLVSVVVMTMVAAVMTTVATMATFAFGGRGRWRGTLDSRFGGRRRGKGNGREAQPANHRECKTESTLHGIDSDCLSAGSILGKSASSAISFRRLARFACPFRLQVSCQSARRPKTPKNSPNGRFQGRKTGIEPWRFSCRSGNATPRRKIRASV